MSKKQQILFGIAAILALVVLSIWAIKERNQPEIINSQTEVPVDHLVILYENTEIQMAYAQFAMEEEDLGAWWDTSIKCEDGSCVIPIPSQTKYLRFNAYEITPEESSWLCSGCGPTAVVDPSATIRVSYGGRQYERSDLEVWSRPSGCSVLLSF